jgi:signal transduction histidine kinase
MGEYPRSELRSYVIAVIAVAIATFIRVELAPDLFAPVTSMPFFVALLIAAWYGGLGPGLLATLLGTLACDWYLFPPIGSFAIAGHEDQLRLVVFVLLGVAISVASETLHAARRRTGAMRADLDERQRMADSLRRLAFDLSEEGHRKDRFLATLSHELRNPLAPMRNALEVMKLAASDPAEVENARRMMERQLAQMVRLVDDLLDVSRISRDKLELRRESVTLRSVVGTAVENARPLIEQQGHRLSVSLPPEPVFLHVDPTRIAQVFSNLLNNAAKYTDRGGEIEVVAHVERDQAIVSVIDNGIGVPPELVSQVLEMFGQADHSLERASGGLGIGLSLAKRLVELHGGRIALRPARSGRGTEVEVRLPTLSADALPASEVTTTAKDPGARPRRRILVADDNVDSANTLATLLDLLGHTTRVAHDGIEAVEVAEAFRPDIVLLDIGMPRLNGHEACRRIRALDWASSVAIVAVTGWGQDQDRERTREAGFDLHLVKPLDPGAIDGLLSDLVHIKTT